MAAAVAGAVVAVCPVAAVLSVHPLFGGLRAEPYIDDSALFYREGELRDTFSPEVGLSNLSPEICLCLCIKLPPHGIPELEEKSEVTGTGAKQRIHEAAQNWMDQKIATAPDFARSFGDRFLPPPTVELVMLEAR
ncbi:MAG: hypothetical protein Q7P63_04185 [Verrucomicrobiota bacterium JB022]|nr:hypothetical protein [Verrucomicrobiota bacterium JB022]